MVVTNFESFFHWLLPDIANRHLGALLWFLVLASVGAVAAITLSYLIAAVRRGPGEGFYAVAQMLANGIPDWLGVSPRRVFAMAYLAIKESVRARVIVALVIFVLIMLNAGWYLDVKSDHPANLYLRFVLNTTTYLVMAMAVLMSTMSLPADIKSRTIYTIVTKPVRASEIVLGRMLGYSLISTVILASMGVISYAFVIRGLGHEHQLDAQPADIERILERDGVWKGQTTLIKHHRHEVTLVKGETEALTEMALGHRHRVIRTDSGWVVGPPIDQLKARVPRYGKLSLRNPDGSPGEGISVGKEWTYRKYIEGDSLAAGVWLMEGITPERFPDGLPLEMTLSVFRTYKGDIETPVKGAITLRNPDRTAPIQSSAPLPFLSREFETDERFFPRKVRAVRRTGEPVQEADIFTDLCDENGRLEIVISCRDRGQYFGASQGDLYLLEAERSFVLNFIKGYLGIWMQMVLIVCFGVMFSTFLSAPIGILASVSVIIMGLMRSAIFDVFRYIHNSSETITSYFGNFAGEDKGMPGGGPIESMIRMATQTNQMVELDINWFAMSFIRAIDFFLCGLLALITRMVPDFSRFNMSDHVAYGYDIGANVLAQQAATFLTYLLVLAVGGYFFLKSREIAAT